MKCAGIDISFWQDIEDYAPFRAVDFAVLKLFEGSSKDGRFEAHFQGLKKFGIPLGVYVFSHASSVDAARREAETAINMLNGRTLELPIFLDMEAADINYAWNSPTTDWALAFGESIKSAGYSWGVYASESWWKHKLDVNAIKASGGMVWVAKYSSYAPELDYDIWQHSDRGRISGWDENLDMNVTRNGLIFRKGAVSEMPKVYPVLSYGSKGTDVKELQILLGKAGYDCGVADGDFGSKTKTALLNFQKANELTADGVAGSATWEKLTEKKQEPTVAESSYDTNKALQAMLTRCGYSCGLIDGVVGQGTQAAVTSFQRANGLTANGTADTATWTKLRECTGFDGAIPVAQANIPYYIFTPEEVTDGLPLVVYLHGDGAVGRPADLQACGILKQTKTIYGDNQPFVLLTPCTSAYSWISEIITPTLKGIIDLVAQLYKSKCVIITGHSRGGIGTWNAVDKYPGYFAKAIPVSGMPLSVEAVNFANTPVWGFVGAGKSDYSVYGDQMANFIDILKRNGCDANLTVMDGMEHGNMSSAPYTKELFDWMLDAVDIPEPVEPPKEEPPTPAESKPDISALIDKVIAELNEIKKLIEKV